ncbi:MAG: hypothetical protein L0Z54_02305 [Thermoplasmata archaeon]|nr:hypothetical protein [Thermoplasmata archaeon]
MRFTTIGLICLVLAITISALPSGEGLDDIITFHRYSCDGPLADVFNEGETIYVNISDGRTIGGSKRYEIIYGNGSHINMECWDNGNNVDKVERDRWYSGAFTPFNTAVPSTYHRKIFFDGDGNYSVHCDLDRRGGGTSQIFTLWIRPFELFVWSVVESSPHVYFNNATKVLYYSNDQAFSAAIDVRLKDNKPGADDRTSWAEPAFGSFPSDADYQSDRHWDFWYTLDMGETCDGNLSFGATDNQHYTAMTYMTVVLDNDPPVVSNVTVHDPHYVGPVYPWWRPASIAGGELNVTWDHVDESGPLTSSLDWDATDDAYDQLGIDPGLDRWEVVVGLDDDGSCLINVTIGVTDQVSNTGYGYTWAGFDLTPPSAVTINATESSDNIHFNGTLLYSNDQVMSDAFELIVVDDESMSGRSDAAGSIAFGNAPKDADYVAGGGWNLLYVIDMGEVSGAITITMWDNVGNAGTAVVQTLLDNVIPEITTTLAETSPWMFIDGSLYFGDSMPSAQDLTIAGTATDPLGLWRADFTDEPNLAYSPPTCTMSGTTDGWSGIYGFDSVSTDGDGIIVVRIYDVVGNMNSTTLIYVRDPLPPRLSTFNYVDGAIVNDGHDMLRYTDPWRAHAAVDVQEAMTALYRVNVSIDDVPMDEWLLPRDGVFNVTSAMVNWTGWHTITWSASDAVNNTRVLETSVLRAPNSTDRRLRLRLDPTARTLVDISDEPDFGASISMAPTQDVWASVMEYPLNPITGYPAGNYTGDPGRNYTTFRYLDIGVNRTAYYGSASIRIYYTEADIHQIALKEDAVFGMVRWDGDEWRWLTSSVVSRVNQTIGFRLYSGYVEVTLRNLYNRSNIFAIAGWRYRVTIREDLCDTNMTIFRDSLVNSYQRAFTIVFRNIGAAADDYFLNATGPNDWMISWIEGLDVRRTIRSAEALENQTVTLYVVIPMGGANVSAGASGMGIAYGIRVTVESITDLHSAMNPWRGDYLDLVGFIRRTDLEVRTVTFDRIFSFIEGQAVIVYVEVYNHGNYTTEDALVNVRMSAGGSVTDLGTLAIPDGALEPLDSAWLIFVTEAPEDLEEMSFNATVTYGGDEYDVESNHLTTDVGVVHRPYAATSTALPALTALALAGLAIALRRRTESRDDY